MHYVVIVPFIKFFTLFKITTSHVIIERSHSIVGRAVALNFYVLVDPGSILPRAKSTKLESKANFGKAGYQLEFRRQI